MTGASTTDWLRRYFDQSTDLVMTVSPETGRILQANELGSRHLGYRVEDLVGRVAREFVHEDDHFHFAVGRAALMRGETYRLEQRWRHADGRWASIAAFACLTDDHNVLLVGRDHSDFSEIQRLVEFSEDLMVVADEFGHVRWANQATLAMHGIGDLGELRGRNLVEFVAESGTRHYYEFVTQAMIDGRGSTRITAVRGDGTDVQLWVRTIFDAERRLWYLVERDISDTVRTENELHRLNAELTALATTDTLTGLANRRAFLSELDRLLDRPAPFALFMIDLDRFKMINDSYGHGSGDELLRIVADRIRRSIRSSDVAARLGGDEFGVLIPSLRSESWARHRAGQILDALDHPMQLAGRTIHLSCSIGAALADSGDDAAGLMARADSALYRAKEEGRHRCRLFDAELERETAERTSIERDLGLGLAADRLRTDVQGLFDADSLRLVGVEALARWTHPSIGPIGPAVFTVVAEEAGLLDELTMQMVRRIGEADPGWSHPFQVGLNVAPSQLVRPGFCDALLEEVDAIGRPPRDFVIEMTETGLTGTLVDALANLRRLKDAGFSLVIDDFGKGASSLGYLRDLPLDAVKIDGTFVHRLATDEVTRTITESVIQLATRLDLAIVAEWVESPEQLRLLREMGCTQVQGFLLHRPEPIGDFDPAATAADPSLLALGHT
ncbi:MAG: EAL domain-containing protein [Actinomycetota bacterium]